MDYSARDILRLAKRWKNAKRTYLLVNPLQGKHMPASPTAALDMMQALGDTVAAGSPDVSLVIGFAETATAIGAAAAARQGAGCAYIHTTREPFAAAGETVDFLEEHSHAAEQRLCADKLEAWLERPGTAALVDDEISTGRTIQNIARALRRRFPALAGQRITAASIINRLPDERLKALADDGIDCRWLLRLPLEDYTAMVERFAIRPAEPPGTPSPGAEPIGLRTLRHPLPDPRRGVDAGDYLRECESAAASLKKAMGRALSGKRVIVLGTEECMFPGLVFGRHLERSGLAASVRFHATTRSPIGICGDADYPIRDGFRLRSCYDAARTTFIYDLEPCDAAVILTDAPAGPSEYAGCSDLVSALRAKGCPSITFVRRLCDVQHV